MATDNSGLEVVSSQQPTSVPTPNKKGLEDLLLNNTAIPTESRSNPLPPLPKRPNVSVASSTSTPKTVVIEKKQAPLPPTPTKKDPNSNLSSASAVSVTPASSVPAAKRRELSPEERLLSEKQHLWAETMQKEKDYIDDMRVLVSTIDALRADPNFKERNSPQIIALQRMIEPYRVFDEKFLLQHAKLGSVTSLDAADQLAERLLNAFKDSKNEIVQRDLSAYRRILSQYDGLRQIMNSIEEKQPAVWKRISEKLDEVQVEQGHAKKGLDLAGYTIMGVQKTPRYELLFSVLGKSLDKSKGQPAIVTWFKEHVGVVLNKQNKEYERIRTVVSDTDEVANRLNITPEEAWKLRQSAYVGGTKDATFEFGNSEELASRINAKLADEVVTAMLDKLASHNVLKPDTRPALVKALTAEMQAYMSAHKGGTKVFDRQALEKFLAKHSTSFKQKLTAEQISAIASEFEREEVKAMTPKGMRAFKRDYYLSLIQNADLRAFMSQYEDFHGSDTTKAWIDKLNKACQAENVKVADVEALFRNVKVVVKGQMRTMNSKEIAQALEPIRFAQAMHTLKVVFSDALVSAAHRVDVFEQFGKRCLDVLQARVTALNGQIDSLKKSGSKATSAETVAQIERLEALKVEASAKLDQCKAYQKRADEDAENLLEYIGRKISPFLKKWVEKSEYKLILLAAKESNVGWLEKVTAIVPPERVLQDRFEDMGIPSKDAKAMAKTVKDGLLLEQVKNPALKNLLQGKSLRAISGGENRMGNEGRTQAAIRDLNILMQTSTVKGLDLQQYLKKTFDITLKPKEVDEVFGQSTNAVTMPESSEEPTLLSKFVGVCSRAYHAIVAFVGGEKNSSPSQHVTVLNSLGGKGSTSANTVVDQSASQKKEMKHYYPPPRPQRPLDAAIKQGLGKGLDEKTSKKVKPSLPPKPPHSAAPAA